MPKKALKLSAEQNLENLIQDFEDEYLFPYESNPPDTNQSEEYPLDLNEPRLYKRQTR